MVLTEDPGQVLDQFLQDVSNLPAEITHLLEEIQAKDKLMQECRKNIGAKDGSIQRFIQMSGSLASNPKEEVYSKSILQSFERAQVLQEEKMALSEKASILLDRHVRRLDLKIRELQTDGQMPADPELPSLLNASAKPTNPPAVINGPLQPLQPNNLAVPTTIPAATSRTLQSAISASRGNGVSTNTPTLSSVIQAQLNSSLNPNHAAAAIQRQRESSAGAQAVKRQRLTGGLGTLPTAAAAIARSSSLGPGTPKPGTPGSTTGANGTTRSGSAAPKGSSSAGITKKKLAPHQQMRRKTLKKSKQKKGPGSPGSHTSSSAGSPSSSGAGHDENSEEEDEEMATPARKPATNTTATAGSDNDDAGDDEDGADDKKYCTCQRVSHGDMVACDNDDCPYEWFHWGCVGLTKEPVGSWYCDECRANLKIAAAA